MRHLYIDTTGDNLYSHLANIEAVGPGHILFGSDWPPVPVAHREKIRSITELPLPEADRQAILSGNALHIFKLEQDSADLAAVSLHEQ
jgi:aminocarboxymuconate-semialdehyde decarboxylase